MALTNLHKTWSVGLFDVLIGGSFRPDGATGIVADSEVGPGWDVERTGTGTYLVTFEKPLGTIKFSFFSVREAAGTETIVQGGDYDASARTLEIRVFQAGALVDLTDDANNVVGFMLMVQNTSADVR